MGNRTIMITGCQRSGTNLMNLILDSHPQVQGVDELNLFHWEFVGPPMTAEDRDEITVEDCEKLVAVDDRMRAFVSGGRVASWTSWRSSSAQAASPTARPWSP